MKALAIRTMTALCMSLLLFYAYAWATVEPPPVWEPPQVQICFPIGGGQYCIDVPDEWL